MLLAPCAAAGSSCCCRCPAQRPPAGPAHKPPWSKREFLPRSTSIRDSARLRVGIPQPVHAGDGLRVPRPPTRPTTCSNRSQSGTDVPHQIYLGTLSNRPHSSPPPWSPASSRPHRAAQIFVLLPRSSTDSRCSRSAAPTPSTATCSAWPSAGSASACRWPSTSPLSSTCSRHRPRRRRPRRSQHRRRLPSPSPRHRPSNPRPRRWKLRRTLRGRRGLRDQRSRSDPPSPGRSLTTPQRCVITRIHGRRRSDCRGAPRQRRNVGCPTLPSPASGRVGEVLGRDLWSPVRLDLFVAAATAVPAAQMG